MPKTKFGEETNEPTQPLKSQNKRAYTLKFSPNIKREMRIRYRSLENQIQKSQKQVLFPALPKGKTRREPWSLGANLEFFKCSVALSIEFC